MFQVRSRHGVRSKRSRVPRMGAALLGAALLVIAADVLVIGRLLGSGSFVDEAQARRGRERRGNDYSGEGFAGNRSGQSDLSSNRSSQSESPAVGPVKANPQAVNPVRTRPIAPKRRPRRKIASHVPHLQMRIAMVARSGEWKVPGRSATVTRATTRLAARPLELWSKRSIACSSPHLQPHRRRQQRQRRVKRRGRRLR